jgi:hypothetical protein
MDDSKDDDAEDEKDVDEEEEEQEPPEEDPEDQPDEDDAPGTYFNKLQFCVCITTPLLQFCVLVDGQLNTLQL